MQSWPLGLKIGAVVAVGLIAVLVWISVRQAPDSPSLEALPASRSPGSAPAPARQQLPADSPASRPAAPRQDLLAAPDAGRALPQGQLAPLQPGAPSVEMPTPGAPPEMPAAGAPPVGAQQPARPGIAAPDEEEFESLKQTALTDPDPDERMEAVLLLGTLDDLAVIPVLAQALRDPDPDVRLTAVETLGDFEGSEPLEALQQALKDSNPEVRFEALSLLADIGGAGVRQAIEGAVNDEDEDVRALAQEILEMEDLQ